MTTKRKWLIVGIGFGIAIAGLILIGMALVGSTANFLMTLTIFVVSGVAFSFILSCKKESK